MSKRGRDVWDMEPGSLDTARLLMLLAQHQQHQHQRAVAGAQVMGGGRGGQPRQRGAPGANGWVEEG